MQSSLMPDAPQIATRGGPTRKKKKPFAVWYKSSWPGRGWEQWNRYVSHGVAARAFRLLSRKYDFWEWKIGRAKKGGDTHAN